jgi:hypothetical protein
VSREDESKREPKADDFTGKRVAAELVGGSVGPGVGDELTAWQTESGKTLNIEQSEHGYPVVDLRGEDPDQVLAILERVDARVGPTYHGMHNNDFRRAAGLSEVEPWAALDPALSHQPEGRKAVYSTESLAGAIVHATLEHKIEDRNPVSGETYSLMPNPDGGRFVEVSPQLAEALNRGEERFTGGLLYLLPRDSFQRSAGTSHEMASQERVRPLAVVRIGKELGVRLVNRNTISVRAEGL